MRRRPSVSSATHESYGPEPVAGTDGARSNDLEVIACERASLPTRPIGSDSGIVRIVGPGANQGLPLSLQKPERVKSPRRSETAKTLEEPMTDRILIGRGGTIDVRARDEWEIELSGAPESISRRLSFMSEDHHAVRNYVVRELPRLARPISVTEISNALQLPRERTSGIVDDLERNLFFLVRGDGPEVSWAFPVTVDDTGHRMVFSTGERLDAA